MSERLYFAYGSNINLDQMRWRCPGAEVVGTVVLADYELLFRGFGAGSGLATIAPCKGAQVPGLLWKLTSRCEKALDRYEGFPTLYDKQDVTVRDNGREFTVMAYVMVPNRSLQPDIPSSLYFQGIRDGYRHVGLPTQALDAALEHVQQEVEAQKREWAELWESGWETEEAQQEGAGTLYFAYGSNLNLEQMAKRCPNARPAGNAVLENYALVFRERSGGGGVATVIPCQGQKVHGVMWELTPGCEKSLDRCEGYPVLYDKQTLTVWDTDGQERTVMTYAMTNVAERKAAIPSNDYYNRIWDGYQQNKLPVNALKEALQNLRHEMKAPHTTASRREMTAGKRGKNRRAR